MWPGARDRQLKLKVPTETFRRLEVRSESEGISVVDYATQLLAMALDRTHAGRLSRTTRSTSAPAMGDEAVATHASPAGMEATIAEASDRPAAATTRPSDPDQTPIRLRLYIGGNAPASRLAVQALERLCAEELAGRGQLNVIDVSQRPDLAVRDRIIAVPTLIREFPAPERRVTGDVADRERLLATLLAS